MKICHITTLPIEKMGSITRNIYKNCIGEHIWCYLWDTPKEADVYILHCFKNHYEEFLAFKKPYENCKVISLMHSSYPCVPSEESDLIVLISKNQVKEVRARNDFKFDFYKQALIYPGIEKFNPPSKYKYKAICKIARAEAGKFAAGEKRAIDNVMLKNKNISYSLVCNEPEKVKALLPKKVTLVTNINISENEKKAAFFADKGIYADAHGDFEDTFCIALLEAMANGLACVIMRNGNNYVLDEVLGHCGIIVGSIAKFEFAIEQLLNNDWLRALYGNIARVRAQQAFSLERMIVEWNQIILS